MNRSRAYNITLNINQLKLAVISCTTILFLLLGLYMYFVSYSVVHVVMRQEAEQEVKTLRSEISRLEAEYIAMQHAMSADIASMHGYVAASEKIFIDRTDSVLVLSSSRNP